jgi:predicted metalloprotease
LYDPNSAGGLPVTDGPSGPRDNAPQPTGTVENTDNGVIDRLSLLAINDIEEFWKKKYSEESLKGTFEPVDTIVSYDSDDSASPKVCGRKTAGLINAFYTSRCHLIAWDRGEMFPAAKNYFGDMAVVGILAHEYGHALQVMADLVDNSTPGVVFEQQADCFAGVYMRWVAEGHSPRFTLNTGDGLTHVMAGLLKIADPIYTPESAELVEGGHGTALDRASAFQMGFETGTGTCAKIDMDEIDKRRANLPLSLQEDSAGNVDTGDVEVNKDNVSALMEVLGKAFSPKQPPKLSFDPANCSNAKTTKGASYCPATNTVSVDLPTLQQLGKPGGQKMTDRAMRQGDNTAFSVVASRYVLAVQNERALALDSPGAAVRTACLTGAAQRHMAEPGGKLVLTAGDLDEAVDGLMTNGLAASDVNGEKMPAGFTRILVFRSGVLSDANMCYQQVP